MRWASIGLFVGGIAWTLGAAALQLRGLGSPEAVRVVLLGTGLAAIGGVVALARRSGSRPSLRVLQGGLGLAVALVAGLAVCGCAMLTSPAVAALWRPPASRSNVAAAAAR